MTPAEQKALEASKIQPLLGALAAIASGGLLSLGSEGAPLFTASLLSLAIAYVFWNGVDNLFALQVQVSRWRHGGLIKNRSLIPRAMRYQFIMITYSVAGVFLIVAGFAASHSSISTGVSVEFVFLHALFSEHWLSGMHGLRSPTATLPPSE